MLAGGYQDDDSNKKMTIFFALKNVFLNEKKEDVINREQSKLLNARHVRNCVRLFKCNKTKFNKNNQMN